MLENIRDQLKSSYNCNQHNFSTETSRMSKLWGKFQGMTQIPLINTIVLNKMVGLLFDTVFLLLDK